MVTGTWVYIFGSLVIFLAQSWKVYRAGCVEYKSVPTRTSFKLSNLLSDIPAALIDSTAGLGGFCYLVGSIYFLPKYDTSDYFTWIAANWFISGGVFYLISGLCMFYRYFCTQNVLFTNDCVDATSKDRKLLEPDQMRSDAI